MNSSVLALVLALVSTYIVLSPSRPQPGIATIGEKLSVQKALTLLYLLLSLFFALQRAPRLSLAFSLIALCSLFILWRLIQRQDKWPLLRSIRPVALPLIRGLGIFILGYSLFFGFKDMGFSIRLLHLSGKELNAFLTFYFTFLGLIGWLWHRQAERFYLSGGLLVVALLLSIDQLSALTNGTNPPISTAVFLHWPLTFLFIVSCGFSMTYLIKGREIIGALALLRGSNDLDEYDLLREDM